MDLRTVETFQVQEDAIIQRNLKIFSAIANELRTMLQEKIVKEEMIFIQPHIKLMCDLLAVMLI